MIKKVQKYIDLIQRIIHQEKSVSDELVQKVIQDVERYGMFFKK